MISTHISLLFTSFYLCRLHECQTVVIYCISWLQSGVECVGTKLISAWWPRSTQRPEHQKGRDCGLDIVTKKIPPTKHTRSMLFLHPRVSLIYKSIKLTRLTYHMPPLVILIPKHVSLSQISSTNRGNACL